MTQSTALGWVNRRKGNKLELILQMADFGDFTVYKLLLYDYLLY